VSAGFPPDALQASGNAHSLPHADCYWVWPGRLLGGAHPARHLDKVLAAGVDAFIDLTRAGDVMGSYATQLPAHVRWHGFAIVDYGVPGEGLMRDIVEAIDGELARGGTLYLHCHAGVGRTGTALGCWLVEQGLEGPAALALISRKRSHLSGFAAALRSPETDAQRDFVLRWRARKVAR
jgi:atypical dual specificity phosphatase